MAEVLTKEGYDLEFYSIIPFWRKGEIKISKDKHKSFFILLSPLILISRYAPNRFKNFFNYLILYFLDILTFLFSRKCNIAIFMSQSSLKTIKRYKADNKDFISICERGSTHINTQYEILCSLKGAVPPKGYEISKELSSYAIADFISVPSQHVYDSFIENGVESKKLFKNPYGVDVKGFKPLIKKNNRKIIIQTGAWSIRKGADIIERLMYELPDFEFVHVGPILDYPFPKHPRFIHYDPVPEKELLNFYHKAALFILPSREEGLALVQAQALACGLPVVYSYRSGGDDLKDFVRSKEQLIRSDLSIESLKKAVKKAYDFYTNSSQQGEYIDYNLISWDAYGNRYSEFIEKIINKIP